MLDAPGWNQPFRCLLVAYHVERWKDLSQDFTFLIIDLGNELICWVRYTPGSWTVRQRLPTIIIQRVLLNFMGLDPLVTCALKPGRGGSSKSFPTILGHLHTPKSCSLGSLVPFRWASNSFSLQDASPTRSGVASQLLVHPSLGERVGLT